MNWINRLFPMTLWLRQYQTDDLKGDFFAGITVGIMLIPQGMAYALIAGLPPVYGLYASIVPQIIYAILGTSRQLSVAPVAMDSLLVAAGVSLLATEGTDSYIAFAILIAFFMGSFQLLLGVFRLGFITNLLSKPVISGFTSAAALIIGLNQLKYLMGIQLEKSNRVHEVLISAIDHLNETHLMTLIIGTIGIILIKISKRIHKNLPGALLAVIVGTTLVYFFQLNAGGVSIVAEIPAGLPSFLLPDFSLGKFQELVPLALTISVIAYMEAFSVAKAIESKKRNYKVLPNQELIALGASNLIGSFFQSFPVTGGFSRSAVNYQAGANTPLASVISAILVALTLLFLTPLFYYLPNAILAAVIMVAVSGLVDLVYAKQLWKDNKIEFILLLTTFIITATFDMVTGIVSGIILSILILLYKAAYPHIAPLGRVKNHHEFRNLTRFQDLETWDSVLVYRIDAPITFINIQYLKEYIENAVRKAKGTEHIIIDAGPVSYLDASGAEGIREILTFLNEQKVNFLLCDVIGPVRDVLYKTRLIDDIGEQHIFLSLKEALSFALNKENSDFKSYALQHNE